MTSVDTNVIAGLLNEDETFNLPAKRALQRASSKGALVVCAPVFVELYAMPKRDLFDLEVFLRKVLIDVDWVIEEEVWRKAATANAKHVARRREDAQFARTPRGRHEA